MLRIDLSAQARKKLEDLPRKHARQITERIVAFASGSQSVPVTALAGSTNLWRLRSGEYRVVYRIEGSTIKVLLIAKRNDSEVYKLVRRAKL